MGILLATLGAAWLGAVAKVPGPELDEAQVREAFRQARALTAADGGALWGTSLEGPILVVDRATRAVLASHPDGEGRLREDQGVWRGTLPPDQNAANTAVHWAGVHWTMLMAPLPEDATSRARLLAHELFHRVQGALGLQAASPANEHLDRHDGRLWLRLEMRALRRALTAAPGSDERALCAEDALTFRAWRRELCPDGGPEEDALECNEGICEYTGVRLCGLDPAGQVRHAAARLRGDERSDTLTRSFAYVTGPAYGLLLDDVAPDWRQDPASLTSLSGALARALGYLAPDDLRAEAELLLEEYEGAPVRAEEEERRARRERRRAECLARYFEAPVLVLPLTGAMRYSFDPYQVETLEGVGQVLATARVTDAWGVLEVDGGALLVRRDGRVVEARMPAPTAPTERPVKGDGWTLTLDRAFDLVAGERTGDWTVRRRQ